MNHPLTAEAIKLFQENASQYRNEAILSIEPIHCGYTNQSFLLTTEYHKFQIRLGQNNSIVSRQNEATILKIIQDQYFLYYDVNNGNAVKHWIEGEPLLDYYNTHNHNLDENIIDELLTKIQNLHQIQDANLNKVIPHDYFVFFNNNHDLSIKHKNKYVELVNKWVHSKPWTLSHNDLNLQNILINPNQELIFIDYEWGRINHPYWDIANFIRESQLELTVVQMIADKMHINYQELLEFMYICTNFAYQWTFSTSYSEAIQKYREKTLKLLESYFQLL
ncbi:phosphotransferase [Ureaplasma ceti]|uniref:Choline kinase n=1 Tax=Ureaplasma ceti TaxID=3119530 RepID=A0ABP9U4Z0_9BACT